MRLRIALVVWIASGLTGMAGAAPRAFALKDPKRLIEGHRVDLTPLFLWWTNRHGARPLTAWAHVTGTILATNDFTWTLDAHLDLPPRLGATNSAGEGAPGKVYLALRHPPTWELEDFTRLTTQLKALEDQSQALSFQAATAAAQRRALQANRFRSRLIAAEARQWSAAENQARAQLAIVRRQIANCHAGLAVYPNSTNYTLDCLALDTGLEFHRLPAYDYGLPNPREPLRLAPAPPKPAPGRSTH